MTTVPLAVLLSTLDDARKRGDLNPRGKQVYLAALILSEEKEKRTFEFTTNAILEPLQLSDSTEKKNIFTEVNEAIYQLRRIDVITDTLDTSLLSDVRSVTASSGLSRYHLSVGIGIYESMSSYDMETVRYLASSE